MLFLSLMAASEETSGSVRRELPLDPLRLLDLSHDAIIMLDSGRHIVSWNLGACELYGYSPEEAAGSVIHELLKTRGPITSAEMDAVLEGEGRWDGELVHVRKDGAEVVVESRQVRIPPAAQTSGGVLEINRDITARKRSEAAVLEAQKLESLGLLAGGIAHEFNNLLTSILGNATLAIDLSEPLVVRMLEEVVRAAESAGNLTRQMLAYAGKGRFFIEPIEARQLIRESLALVRPAISRHARIALDLAPDSPEIEGDRSQMQQVVVNLVLNAAEALPEGKGNIRIATGVAEFCEGRFPPGTMGNARPGRFLHVRVSDNGVGMARNIQAQIFDPFFSTKFVGRGLGLAAVLGAVRGHGGFLTFESSPGVGTLFDVYLPAAPPRG